MQMISPSSLYSIIVTHSLVSFHKNLCRVLPVVAVVALLLLLVVMPVPAAAVVVVVVMVLKKLVVIFSSTLYYHRMTMRISPSSLFLSEILS